MPVEVCSHYVPFFVSPTPPSASFVSVPRPRLSAPLSFHYWWSLSTYCLPAASCSLCLLVFLALSPCRLSISGVSRISVS